MKQIFYLFLAAGILGMAQASQLPTEDGIDSGGPVSLDITGT
jgi:hypothetical protein